MGETQRPAPLSRLRPRLSSAFSSEGELEGRHSFSASPEDWQPVGLGGDSQVPQTAGFDSAHTGLQLKAWFDRQVPLAHRIPLHCHCNLQLFMQHFSESHEILLVLKFPPRLSHSAFLSIYTTLSSELANVNAITHR